jgi:hypothetical protein
MVVGCCFVFRFRIWVFPRDYAPVAASVFPHAPHVEIATVKNRRANWKLARSYFVHQHKMSIPSAKATTLDMGFQKRELAKVRRLLVFLECTC